MKYNTYSNSWLEINSKAILSNKKQIEKLLAPNCKLLCVIKADAYGHGILDVAKLLEKDGADYFGVSNISEALELRDAGITSPILILGYTKPQFADLLATRKLTQSCFSFEYANELLSFLKADSKLRIHIKINTGMNRFGFDPNNDEIIDEICSLCSNKKFDVEGIYTHFYNADSNKRDTKIQFDLFTDIVFKLEKLGFTFKIKHCCNSAATINYPSYHLDMVRVGAALYGINTSSKFTFKEAMTLKSNISQINLVRKNETIGYGASYTAAKDSKIAVINAGYCDGINRTNSNKLNVFINNKSCPVVGNICMNQMTVDVSNVKCSVGDEVIIFGKGGTSFKDVAKINSTIPYEIVCNMSRRLKKVIK